MGWNFLYPLGNSDIQFEDESGKPFLLRKVNFREETSKLYMELVGKESIFRRVGKDAFEINGRKLCFPIFIPFLLYAIEKEEVPPSKIFLFATDQERPDVNKQDTIYLAKILKDKIIPEICEDCAGGVEIITINENPANYDDMGRFFMNFEENYRDRLEKAWSNYIQVTAGTPAMGMALLFALSKYPLRVFTIIKTEGIREAYYLKSLIAREYEASIERLLRAYSYSDALVALKNSPLRGRIGSIIEKPIEVMALRRTFSFGEAKKESEAISDDFEGKRKFLRYFSDMLEKPESRLIASFEEFEIYLKKKEYHSACAAFFNFTDILAQIAFEKGTGYNIDGFKECVKKEQIELDMLAPSYPNILKVLRTFKERGALRESKELDLFMELAQDKKIADMVDKLRQTRNKGPFAHDVREFPREQVEYLKTVYMEIKSKLGIEGNFYDEANEFIIRTLKSLI